MSCWVDRSRGGVTLCPVFTRSLSPRSRSQLYSRSLDHPPTPQLAISLYCRRPCLVISRPVFQAESQPKPDCRRRGRTWPFASLRKAPGQVFLFGTRLPLVHVLGSRGWGRTSRALGQERSGSVYQNARRLLKHLFLFSFAPHPPHCQKGSTPTPPFAN